MPEVLCFTLAAPVASFGEVAGNLSRGTQEGPGHSLIVGLIGAALGLERGDTRLLEMSEGLRTAASIVAPGRHLRDYHTVQTAKERKGFRPATRRQLLNDGDINTIITERDYLTDFCATVGVVRADGPFALVDMARALTRPHFTLYLGRKSCPLALPMRPQMGEAESIEVALSAYERTLELRTFFPLPEQDQHLVADRRLYPDQLQRPHRVRRRRTRPEDRATWRYRLLDELVLDPRMPSDEEVLQ